MRPVTREDVGAIGWSANRLPTSTSTRNRAEIQRAWSGYRELHVTAHLVLVTQSRSRLIAKQLSDLVI